MFDPSFILPRIRLQAADDAKARFDPRVFQMLPLEPVMTTETHHTALSFNLHTTEERARRGTVTTPHGSFETPAFMPVGTRATVKGMLPRDLEATNSQICLANTYHLHVAPGDKVVKKLGGLHQMMGWNKPILTDSGGFQVFSLPKLEMDEEGVLFQFQKSGKPVKLTPERSMMIQNNLGADIIMAFDVCVPYPSPHQEASDAVYRTIRWLERCKQAHARTDQALFGIVQGSTYPDLRALSAQLTSEIDLPGYAIGGVSVGEGHDLMMLVVDSTEPLMPKHKPRYLMGVGYPEDIVEAAWRGVDMFDCVLPSRYGRSGMLFTRKGRLRVTKGKFKSDLFPIDPQCNCTACSQFSRGYINHLLNSSEILGSTLGTMHNITFYQDLMRAIRLSIEGQFFKHFRAAFLDEFLEPERQQELHLQFPDAHEHRAMLPWDTTHSVLPSTQTLDALMSGQAPPPPPIQVPTITTPPATSTPAPASEPEPQPQQEAQTSAPEPRHERTRRKPRRQKSGRRQKNRRNRKK